MDFIKPHDNNYCVSCIITTVLKIVCEHEKCFSTWCFCGNGMPQEYDKRPEADCNMNCAADSTKKCGGSWRNSIYRTSSG